MGKLNASKMSEIATERAKRTEKLRVLTSTPFDLDNKEHTGALKNYIDSFELTVNQMYLFQAMSAGLTTWGGSWIVGFFLPIPDFANYFLTAVLYFGVAGYILERFSMTDFFEQLAEMKTIYNWCLKNGQENYGSAADNTQNLAYPDIQRMIKLISPLCSTEFMLAWPKEAKEEDQKGGLSSVLSTGYSIVSSTFSLFSSSTKPKIDLNRIRELKVNVETRNFDVGVFNGLEQAIKYFATSPDFRELMTAKIRQPVETVKQMVPSAIMGGFSPSSFN
ncbi:hypothetical protein [Legionella maioricensis]|uniref:Phosphatase n=1 Tax=Legionella maioricensis TaxID=2896528 RepID=A0A9X2D218_9GAMM|nr:hypothetical protein [Legionella maioricensis]MCL9684312.1 hypothetical protein [Legionella maioricensis]MCL9687178.1 hypothetical protein [Legionella maioricensis]